MDAAENAAAANRAHGRDVDDAAVATIDEARQDAAGDEVRSADVDIEDAVPLLLIDVEEAGRRRDAGVVDECRDRRQIALHRRHRRVDLGALGYIAGEPDGL